MIEQEYDRKKTGKKTLSVGELIERLKTYPEDMPVIICDEMSYEMTVGSLTDLNDPDDYSHYGDKRAVCIYGGDEV